MTSCQKHENHQKSPKSWFFAIFSLFFQAKLHFLAMMCVKVCLHMFVLQINPINKIKHSESVSWKQKTRFVCNFHWKSVLVSFSLDPALYYATPRHNPRSDFKKNGLKLSARLEEKSHEVSARKNNNRLRYNKKCRGGTDSAPRLF